MADTAPMGKDEAIDLLRDALEHYQRLAPNTITAPEALRLTAHLAPSTAPEVDERAAFEAWHAEHGNVLAKESQWWAWAGRAALASRPAEVDDEGLPPMPATAVLNFGVRGYTAEQYRQGQRDAVAAYKKKQAALQELADQAQENDMGYGDAVAADRARRAVAGGDQ